MHQNLFLTRNYIKLKTSTIVLSYYIVYILYLHNWYFLKQFAQGFSGFQAKNIKNKPIINRDIQSIRFEEMQTEIMVSLLIIIIITVIKLYLW